MTGRDGPGHIAPGGLRGRRCRTGKMIRGLPGGPDRVAPNPRYRGAPQTKPYPISRVAAADDMPDADAMREARGRRSAAARQAAATRKENIPKRAAACGLQCGFGEPPEEVRRPPSPTRRSGNTARRNTAGTSSAAGGAAVPMPAGLERVGPLPRCPARPGPERITPDPAQLEELCNCDLRGILPTACGDGRMAGALNGPATGGLSKYGRIRGRQVPFRIRWQDRRPASGRFF